MQLLDESWPLKRRLTCAAVHADSALGNLAVGQQHYFPRGSRLGTDMFAKAFTNPGLLGNSYVLRHALRVPDRRKRQHADRVRSRLITSPGPHRRGHWLLDGEHLLRRG